MTRRLILLFAIFMLALVTAAFAFSLEEGRTFADGLWWACVTATTVGYGDIAPATALGRITAVLLMVLTTFCIVPLLTAEIAAKLIVNSDAFTHDEQEHIKSALDRIERAAGKGQGQS